MKKIYILSALLVLVLTGCSINLDDPKSKKEVLKPVDAQQMIEEYINKNLVQTGDAKVDTPVLEDGLYKVVVNLPNGKSVDAYMTTDGKKFFPNVLDIEAKEEENAQPEDGTTETPQQQPSADLPKSDKPKVEAFVMSHCPYGTQIEKGILPVVDLLKNKIDFEIKFVNYTMHGAEENQEQLAQHCIKTEQKDKFYPYLKCFLKAGDSKGCLKTAVVNEGKVKACSDATAKKFGITDNGTSFKIYDAENKKYGVQGSPTLVVNGQQAESGRDSASLLKTICSAFKKAPEECSKQLSSATPAPGFGEGTGSAAGSNAGCGQ